MAVQFHTLTVSGVEQQTKDAIAITFDVPATLKPAFLYKAGQYLTVRAVLDGVEHRRNYSLCSSPFEEEPLKIAVKMVHDGAVSQWLNQHAAAGMQLDVYPPMGNFTKECSPENVRHYVLFAGGSGITPMMSITRCILRVEPRSVVTLFYANRSSDSIIFDKELAALAEAYPKALRLIHVLESEADASRTPYIGRMDSSMVERLLTDKVPSYDAVEAFVCGPPGMMENVIDVLHGKGLPDTRIHREYFTIEKKETALKPDATEGVADEKLITRKVKVKLYGEEFEIEVDPEETILSAAQREGFDPPYACQIGACCTCRAKIVSGKVIMDEREALSDDEIEEGYALTCQSHPITDGVYADYDQ
jgi:ring-1,2-phenylacetyl-CoA epoxidase subunit PaaE